MKYIAKDEIHNYPLLDFNGNIHLIQSESDIKSSCEILARHKVIGFDTETKPSFKKGVSYNISLLQLSAGNSVYLFRINKIGFDKKIIEILSNKNILKVGIDIKNDLLGLKKLKSFKENNFVDLNTLAIKKGYQSIGAVKLSIMLLGCRISKSQRLSDWSADNLTESQINYAAIDAWICPKILQSFKDKSLFP